MMSLKNQKNAHRLRLGYLSAKYSKVDKEDWVETKNSLTNILKKRGLDVYLIIRMFGRDEIWAVFSYAGPEAIRRIKKNRIVNYVATLTRSLPFDEKIVADIVEKALPVAYLMFRRSGISLEETKEIVEASGGRPFLVGAMNHPRGYSHAVLLTGKTGEISDLNETIYNAMKRIQSKNWKCFLGAKHGWPKASKPETGNLIRQIMEEWEKAYTEGKLTDIDREQIMLRWGREFPPPKKKKANE